MASFRCWDHPLDKYSWQVLSLFDNKINICFLGIRFLGVNTLRCEYTFKLMRGPPDHSNFILIEYIIEWVPLCISLTFVNIFYAFSEAECLFCHIMLVSKIKEPILYISSQRWKRDPFFNTLKWPRIIILSSSNQLVLLLLFNSSPF